MFSKHYDDGDWNLRFSQGVNYSFENLLQETKTKNTETIKPSMLICLRKNWAMNCWVLLIIRQSW